MSIPTLDLSAAERPEQKSELLRQLRQALFDVGFLYITNHGVSQNTIDRLTELLPALFALSNEEKLSSANSTALISWATAAMQRKRRWASRTYESRPNQWPDLPGFQEAFIAYHDALQELSYRFVHLIEEAFEIPIGTFDHFFGLQRPHDSPRDNNTNVSNSKTTTFLPPQHRIKLLRYPPSPSDISQPQGVGAHKDSSGWLTFLYQVGRDFGLEVLSSAGDWIKAPPTAGTFVVNFGNAFEAATEGAVKATTHCVIAPGPDGHVRYSIPFFQGLPLDMTVSEIRRYVPEHVRRLRKTANADAGVSSFLDPRWDSLGESQLRKWIRSHKDVGLRWYGKEVVEYYMA